ncbi:hypothetical protein CfE428DRAFT_1223 [Chthoniobacter flavus Ellin428]|uniref:Uncharacterized protein n=1 Tax=Chthoniobacter flavus Ellin428 TaxID=497964 RepID=B4CXD2_9BACT|nr:hypothetical protein [Chthoniobacter flavus]EDY20930.1 hypothetical protein CfE428DRAFT_1223 [Chthoniobacter flavus Ellin428]TCO88662.1 hypothetical protein EV701_11634 [Chthoniobacter flavus]
MSLSPDTSISPSSARHAWPRVILCLGLAAIGAGVWAWQSIATLPLAALDKGTAMVKEIGHQAATVAHAFRERNVREEFLSSAATLTGTRRLQVATLQEHETFRRKESNSLAWGLIPLPSIVVQADVPVEYGYYLDFDGPWEFQQQDGAVTVYPPVLVPSTPASDISKLTFYTIEGHVWQDDKAVRNRLLATLTPALHRRAVEHIPMVKEIARQQVQIFVGKWLTASFSDGHEFHVKVVFPDERLTPAPGEAGSKVVSKAAE